MTYKVFGNVVVGFADNAREGHKVGSFSILRIITEARENPYQYRREFVGNFAKNLSPQIIHTSNIVGIDSNIDTASLSTNQIKSKSFTISKIDPLRTLA